MKPADIPMKWYLVAVLLVASFFIGWCATSDADAAQQQNFGGSLPSGLAYASPTLTISSAGSGNGALALSGNTSGAATFTAPAIAGTPANPVTLSNSLTIANNGTLTSGSVTTTTVNVAGTVAQIAGQNTVGATGVPGVYGQFAGADNDQTASLADTTLFTTVNDGLYRVSLYVFSNNTCATPGTAGVTAGLKWTDDAGNKSTAAFPLTVNSSVTLTSSVPLGDVTSWGVGTVLIHVNPGIAVKFNTTLTACTSGTAKYRIDPVLEEVR